MTVVATQSSPHGTGVLAAYDEDGEKVYTDRRLGTYFDVDPSPVGSHTVVGVGAKPLENCGQDCYRIQIYRVNLTTGDRTVVYETHTAGKSSRWHDVDRFNATHFLVADIETDRVKLLDTRTGAFYSIWGAASTFTPESGGSRAADWTHLNDVERLPDGRLMLSPRNHDQVVFIDDGTLQQNWTLGADDRHSVLYEQHNPDYIPRDRGGPAVLVADSENNRIVEYQRQDGEWVRSWTYEDSRLSWPRDADRLPDGTTLIADSHGDRVFRVDGNGQVQWSMTIDNPYDAERLGTGDESAGGQSARRLDLQSATRDVASADRGVGGALLSLINLLVPAKVVHAIQFVTPPWVSVFELVGILLVPTSLLGWLWFELRLRGLSVQVRSPVKLRDE